MQMTSAQTEGSEIVQSGIAQFENTPVPSILSLVTFTHHVEIINRCQEFEEKVFYMLYTAHQHLKVEELRRCVANFAENYKRKKYEYEIKKIILYASAHYCFLQAG